jgi:uncharacterized protein
MDHRPTVAVVGSGVAGLTAAYLLQRKYDVSLFESQPRLGGHADTHDVSTPDSGDLAVDTGFIVHNRRTYPHLVRLFTELDVRTTTTEMSMSVSCRGCGLEYAGGRRARGLFPHAGHLRRPAYLRMLTEVTRFYQRARRLLDQPHWDPADEVTLEQFLTEGRFSRYFQEHFMLPLVSAVWSAPESVSASYPIRYLLEFMRQHGLLTISGSPVWRTVVGGSRGYVARIAERLSAVHADAPVRAVRRSGDGVVLHDDAGTTHHADRVVIATHADQALALLADPTDDERRVLGEFGYTVNETILHTDASVLPRNQHAMASWNYLKPSCQGASRVMVTYHMNRLMRLPTAMPILVSLNADDRVETSAVLARMTYRHPMYTPRSVAAQRLLPDLNTGRTAFAGAYHGWGFHEDGCVAGARAAAAFGAHW